MPIFRLKEKIIYYAHIPKTGGTSVANFLHKHSDNSAFIFSQQWKQAPRIRWSATSPQHISASNLLELFPRSFFDYSFAIVRHPEDRVISEYKFRAARSSIHSSLPFSDWLSIVLGATKANPFVFDSHLRPQSDFIPPDTQIFKLEEGFASLTDWLTDSLHIDRSGMDFNVHANKSVAIDVKLSSQDRHYINEYYAADFEQFGYEARIEEDMPVSNGFKALRQRFLGAFSRGFTRMLSHRIPY